MSPKTATLSPKPATLSLKYTMSPVSAIMSNEISSFRQSRHKLNVFNLLRHCRKYEISFDIIAETGDIVAKNRDIVAETATLCFCRQCRRNRRQCCRFWRHCRWCGRGLSRGLGLVLKPWVVVLVLKKQVLITSLDDPVSHLNLTYGRSCMTSSTVDLVQAVLKVNS